VDFDITSVQDSRMRGKAEAQEKGKRRVVDGRREDRGGERNREGKKRLEECGGRLKTELINCPTVHRNLPIKNKNWGVSPATSKDLKEIQYGGGGGKGGDGGMGRGIVSPRRQKGTYISVQKKLKMLQPNAGQEHVRLKKRKLSDPRWRDGNKKGGKVDGGKLVARDNYISIGRRGVRRTISKK